jgi:hypothetical protein
MENGGSPARPLTKAQETKARAWARQSAALGAPGYRITLTARRHNLKTFSLGKGRGEDGAEKIYSADEITALIPYLSRQNLIGFDVYITPIDSAHHFILVDDTTLEKIEDMRSRGFTPALVQESSAGNVQAVFRVPRTDAPQEQKGANALMVQINKEWGDPKIMGAQHPFRMAGFSNKKTGRGDVFTRIIDAAGVVCEKAAAMLAGAVQRLQERSRAPAAPLIDPAPPSPADARFVAIRARERGLAVSKGWTLNEDTLDYRTAVALIAENFTDEEIAGAMLRNSPDLAARHPKTTVYLRKTVEAAGRAQPRPDDEPTPEDGPTGPSL